MNGLLSVDLCAVHGLETVPDSRNCQTLRVPRQSRGITFSFTVDSYVKFQFQSLTEHEVCFVPPVSNRADALYAFQSLTEHEVCFVVAGPLVQLSPSGFNLLQSMRFVSSASPSRG